MVSDTELGLLLVTEFTQNVEFNLGFVHIPSILGVKDLPFNILALSWPKVSFEDSEKLCNPNLLNDTSSSVSKCIGSSSSSISVLADELARFFIRLAVEGDFMKVILVSALIDLYVNNAIKVHNVCNK